MGEDSRSAASVQQCFAGFLMALGPGTALAFYTAMGGFYIEKFQNRSFIIYMLLCVHAPMPVMSLLQRSFDAFFDEKFSARVTYAFRVIAMQLVLACGVLGWIVAPESQLCVLGIGVLLGIIGSVIISSSLQMVAAIDPTCIIYAKLGLQTGGFVPILVLSITNFHPDSSRSEFQRVLSTSVGVCTLASCVLSYLNLSTDIFAIAYKRLSCDLEIQQEDPGENDRLMATRQLLTSHPEAAKHGVPPWVQYWQGCLGLLMGIAMYLTSLSGFFGDSSMAQTLSLLKLAMDFLGRIAAVPIPCIPSFAEGPWHKVMAACVVLVLTFGGVCFANLFGSPIPPALFVMSWCSLFAITYFTTSLVDVTSGSYVEVRHRKSVARMNQLVLTASVFIGLLLSEATSVALRSHSSPMTPLQ